MTNLGPNDLVFRVDANLEIDLSAYDLNSFLSEIWDYTFAKWDSRVHTVAAQDFATKAQNRAEIFWRYHLEGKTYNGSRFVSR